MSRVALHLSVRVKQRWPLDYWIELIRRLTRDGHDVFVFSDEEAVAINDDNPRLHDRCRLPDNEARAAVASCDVFVGVPGTKFYGWAAEAKTRIVGLKGATLVGPGVASPIQCAGCEDKGIESVDCFFRDEICMTEILPLEVYRAVAA